MTSRSILMVFIAICAFAYGLVVATYKIFPFSQLQYAKSLIVEERDDGISAAEAKNIERFRVYYLDRKSFFERHATAADIVMIGDSMVDSAEWDELLPNTSIVNRGIRGDTMGGVIDRMDSIYAVGAKQAFIMVGYNDLRKSIPANEVFASYKVIVEGLLKRGTQPYINSTILVGRELVEWNEHIMQLNTLLENYAREKGLVYIDLNATLALNGELNPAFTTDGVHLNGEGYATWVRAIRPYMMAN